MPEFNLDAALSDGTFHAAYLEFPAQQQAYGRGGWGRGAHRPHPKLVTKITSDVRLGGKSVFIDGVRRLKCNLWKMDGTAVRTDYHNIFLDKDGVIKLL